MVTGLHLPSSFLTMIDSLLVNWQVTAASKSAANLAVAKQKKEKKREPADAAESPGTKLRCVGDAGEERRGKMDGGGVNVRRLHAAGP